MSYRQGPNPDKNIAFAEYFNSEQETRRNGGAPTLATFGSGNVQFDATAFNRVSFDKIAIAQDNTNASNTSIRFIKLKNASISQGIWFIHEDFGTIGFHTNVFCFRNNVGAYYAVTLLADVEYEIVFTVNSSGTILGYVNGILATNTGVGGYAQQPGFHVGCYGDVSGAFPASGELGGLEVYNKTLSPEEVSNLYNDARYVVPNFEHGEQLDSPIIPTLLPLGPGGIFTSPDTITYDTVVSVFMRELGGFEDGKKYRITGTILNHTGSFIHPIYDGTKTTDINGNSITIQPGTAQSFDYYYIPSGTNMYSYMSGAGTADVTFNIQEVSVEPTKEILNVNAFSGVARNVLSGDGADTPIVDHTFDFTDAWVGVNASFIGEKTFTLSASGGIYKGLATVGKRYKVRAKGTNTSGNILLLGNTGIAFGAGATFDGTWYGTQAVNANIYLTGGDGTFTFEIFDIQEVIPEVINTDIEVVKDGQIRVPRFDGASSDIDCGDYNDLTGDISIISWHKPKSYGLGGASGGRGVILTNGTFGLALFGTSDRYAMYSGGIFPGASGDANVIDLMEINFIAITRKASGLLNAWCIVDGSLKQIATDYDSGTPAVGTANITIGSGTGWWEGDIPEVRVIEGLLTPEEISQYYSSTKHLYQK